ncbi:MAG: DUF5655 domain-containing protein, partial [Candidatus Paceibacterota bacterium]
LSDRPFHEKQKMKGGFADSPIRLNRDLATVDYWDESTIYKRAGDLAVLALKVWQSPQVPAEALAKVKEEKKVGKRERVYSLDVHMPNLQGEQFEVFQELRKRILNLDSSVHEEIKRRWIAYKSEGINVVDVVPQRTKLVLSLKVPISEIRDPRGICRDVSEIGRWGSGTIEAPIASREDIEYAMDLIRQAFEFREGE